MTSNEIILAFVEAINAHDVSRLGKLMTNDHTFVDPYGSEVTGREPMRAGADTLNGFPIIRLK